MTPKQQPQSIRLNPTTKDTAQTITINVRGK